ncbi:MAG: cellobiose transport system permease protein, partial [Micromonosporaceae bacterium]|nr:cellobiose transport system permease protein [Micromonosporaceae bacterium]
MAVMTKPSVGGVHSAPRAARAARYRLDVKGSPYLYIAPFFIIFGIFGLFPLIYTGWVSITGWRADT